MKCAVGSGQAAPQVMTVINYTFTRFLKVWYFVSTWRDTDVFVLQQQRDGQSPQDFQTLEFKFYVTGESVVTIRDRIS
jgi:hypothetical protein